MMPRLTSHPRRWQVRAIVAAFLLKAFVPIGYMPASADSGWLLQLCPGSSSEAVMAFVHPDHLDHHDAASASSEVWLDCPFDAVAPSEWIAPGRVRLERAASLDSAYAVAVVGPAQALRWSDGNRTRAPPMMKRR